MTPEDLGAETPDLGAESTRPSDDAPGEKHEGMHAGATGNPVVDAVLASLDRVEGTPVADHVEIFESAHERLRSALAEAGEGAPGHGHDR